MTSEEIKEISFELAKLPQDILEKIETISNEVIKTRKIFRIDDTIVKTYLIDDIDENEARNYVNYIQENVGVDFSINKLAEVEIFPTPRGKVRVDYKIEGQPFERIRRITGL